MILFWVLMVLFSLGISLLVLLPLLIARFLFPFILFIILVPVFALAVYGYWGSSELITAWSKQQEQTAQVQTLMEEFKSPDEVINALKLRLQENPQSAKAWYLLGKLYLDQQNYPEAKKALAEADHLKPHKVEIMVAYAQALFFVNNRELNPSIMDLLTQVLEKDPQNMEALNLWAIGSYNAGDYEKAIHYWQQLLPLLSENTQEQSLLLQMINQAKKKAA